MSHKSQSIKYSRTEAKRIYHQRQLINKLVEENQQLKEKINVLTDKLEEVEGQYAYECGCNRDLVKYQNLIEHLKTIKLYNYGLDYDYEDNPHLNYYIFDMEQYIDNWWKVEEIDNEENDN